MCTASQIKRHTIAMLGCVAFDVVSSGENRLMRYPHSALSFAPMNGTLGAD